MARIAVEQPFDDVKMALEEQGHEVKMFQQDEMVEGYDLGVVRALGDTNSKQFNFPVITAEGMSVNDIVTEAQSRLDRMT